MVPPRQYLLCEKLCVTFNNMNLLEKALTHSSVGVNNNELLEYLGDAILNFIITEDLFNRFPHTNEGKLSQLRASLVKGETLSKIAKELNLGEVLILGQGEINNGGFRRESILANAMEAIFGAIYLDGGLEFVKVPILKLFNERLNTININQTTKDPKTRLQELLQSRKHPLPIYTIKEIRIDKQQLIFEASCQVPVLDKAIIGRGSSHRKAEQKTAERVLILIGDGSRS
ncbi:MAG: ribonuclease III [Piscirickettsiaceae bacterium]|nr:ribonuclease III [Piscirickettsiaceae bacterium]